MKLITIWMMTVISVIIEVGDCDESQASDNTTDITEPPTVITDITEETVEVTQSITTEPTEIVSLSTTVQSVTPAYWLSKTGDISNDLINAQAILVKDEDVEEPCNRGERKSQHRYLMCAGSILTENHVLTSASCLHEALHIRHNIRAPLAVAIAPLKSTVQIIRIAEYRIHPKHNTNPYSPDHADHNIAILSLSCKINRENYRRIELPDKPMASLCANGNCLIAIYRIAGHASNVVSQIPAPTVPLAIRKRSVNNEHRFKRYTDGSKFCAATGTAVMLNTTQTAIVAASCDDRQPSTRWSYTDLYTNQDWIYDTLRDWNHTNVNFASDKHTRTHSDHSFPFNSSMGNPSKSCANCIFNFYISIGCKGKSNCQNKSISSVNAEGSTLLWEKTSPEQNCSNGDLDCPSRSKDTLELVKSEDNSTKHSDKPKAVGDPDFGETGTRRGLGLRRTFQKPKQPKLSAEQRMQDRMRKWRRMQSSRRQPVNQGINRRTTREANPFIRRDFDDPDDSIMKMHALIVRDEETSRCCETAKQVSAHRYFMCSGAILSLKHAITTASCMHFADIYEHHIDADLAVMVGATTSNSYIIKINRYEMHPNYVFDVDATDHSTHNLAILFLACSIKSTAALVPKLPRGVNNDVGHHCCSRNCTVVTIVQSYDNLQAAKLLTAKHLPSPRHDDDADDDESASFNRRSNSKLPNTRSSIRSKRSQGRSSPTAAMLNGGSSWSSSIKNAPASFQDRREPNGDINLPLPDQSNHADAIDKLRRNRMVWKAKSGKSPMNSLMIDEVIASTDWNSADESPLPLTLKPLPKLPYNYHSMRSKRSQGRLAPAPSLFNRELTRSSLTQSTPRNSKKNRKPKPYNNLQLPNQSKNADIIAGLLTDRIFWKVNGRRSLSNSSMMDEAIASVDWNNVEEAMDQKITSFNKLVINQFVESVIKETMKRVVTALGGESKASLNGDSRDSNFFGTLLSHSSGNRSIDDFSQALTKIITNLMPPNDGNNLAVSSDLSIDERDVGKPPMKYANCPPLGAPVIMDGTLIGMVAYTCDDIQSWVEWKYVSVSNNLVWIRKRLAATQHQALTNCQDTSRNGGTLDKPRADSTDGSSDNGHSIRSDRRLFNDYVKRN